MCSCFECHPCPHTSVLDQSLVPDLGALEPGISVLPHLVFFFTIALHLVFCKESHHVEEKTFSSLKSQPLASSELLPTIL